MEISENHPRYESLRLRELIADGYENGLVDRTGLIAHGRGEAFDYLLGERTHAEAADAARAAAAHLLLANNPTVSVNGNTAVLVTDELVELSRLVPAKLEVNIFHRTDDRMERLIKLLEDHGAEKVLGRNPDKSLPKLSHQRAHCTSEGIYSADVVLVPLEDGDRAEVLSGMNKTVIVVDLNPLSRSARCGTITIVDNICRALKVLIQQVTELKNVSDEKIFRKIIADFDNKKNLELMLMRLKSMNSINE
jgi:4-phosphopantoate--beta-alanine ligase